MIPLFRVKRATWRRFPRARRAAYCPGSPAAQARNNGARPRRRRNERQVCGKGYWSRASSQGSGQCKKPPGVTECSTRDHLPNRYGSGYISI